MRSAAALGVSILVAFFPKCPVCWAAYSSGLGIAGISSLPYTGFLFPVLVAMLGVHLWLLLRQSARVGYGPFLISIAGIGTLLVARRYGPPEHWVLNGGILLIVGGSLWNSFSMSRPRTRRPLAIGRQIPAWRSAGRVQP